MAENSQGALSIDRRGFISMAVSASAAASAARLYGQSLNRSAVNPPGYGLDEAADVFESTTIFDDEARLPALRAVQAAINAVNRKEPYLEFVSGGPDMPQADVSRLVAEMPVLGLYDRAFDKVMREFSEAKIRGKPMVWYVYNMGIVVKTESCAFSIDLCHRKAPLLAPMLDFALCTHNHSDHYTRAFFAAMKGKPIISNFHLCRKWYSRDLECEWQIGDVVVRCTSADHNEYLPRAVTCFETLCGRGNDPFVIFHSGDTQPARQLKRSVPHPDLFFGHCAIGFRFSEAAKTTMPAKLLLPVHHQELGHLGGPWRCVAFEDEPLQTVRRLRSEGHASAMPVWGDRIC